VSHDVIDAAANDLLARIQPLVESEALYVYDVDEMLHEKSRLSLPNMSLVYAGMTPTGNKAADATFDLYVCAGRDRENRVDGLAKITGTSILADIRNAIMKTTFCYPPTATGHQWRMGPERPVGIDGNLIVYLQKWITKVILVA